MPVKDYRDRLLGDLIPTGPIVIPALPKANVNSEIARQSAELQESIANRMFQREFARSACLEADKAGEQRVLDFIPSTIHVRAMSDRIDEMCIG